MTAPTESRVAKPERAVGLTPQYPRGELTTSVVDGQQDFSWLGLLTCKNRRPYNLYCVGGDVKTCSINQQDFSVLSWVVLWHRVCAVVESQPDNVLDDLRLDRPFDSFIELCDSLDLSTMTRKVCLCVCVWSSLSLSSYIIDVYKLDCRRNQNFKC